MSDTPRTDAAAGFARKGWGGIDIYPDPTGNIVRSDFARRLERELAEAKKDGARLNWLQYTAEGIDWQHNYLGLIDRAAIDAAMEASK